VSPPLAKPGVLVAVDDTAIRQLLEYGLSQHGLVVWTAANCPEALDLFRRHSDAIQVALLNVRLPGLDGPATLHALRELRPGLPCCFMSGGTGNFSAQTLLDMGSTRLIEKPFSLPELTKELLHLAGHPERRTEGRVPVLQRQSVGRQIYLRDRSRSGLGLWSPDPMAVGSMLSLQLDDGSGMANPYHLEVRNCQPNADGWVVGCRIAS
jgi:DNA-binding response OmpR family regulator